jgi:Mn-dependent DtxR family transcriptional regulator
MKPVFQKGGICLAIQESGEMYLESIYVLSQKGEPVHAIDVGKYMGYSKPSVSRAMGLLKKDGYIEVDEESHIALTERGLIVAKKIYERHTVLTELLVRLGVDREIASEDACRIEHAISDDSFQAIQAHINKYL